MLPDLVKAHVGWKENSSVWRSYYCPGLILLPFDVLFFMGALPISVATNFLVSLLLDYL